MDYTEAELYQSAPNTASEGLLAGLSAGMLIFWLLIVVLSIVGLWKVFTKAGKPGWASIVPIYNDIPFFVKYHFDFTDPSSGAVSATYDKTTTLRDHYKLTVMDGGIASTLDWRVLVSLGVMMDALQSR